IIPESLSPIEFLFINPSELSIGPIEKERIKAAKEIVASIVHKQPEHGVLPSTPVEASVLGRTRPFFRQISEDVRRRRETVAGNIRQDSLKEEK
ncbi:hypothetical protein QYM36_001032, partial [Artemia franciscana]